MSITHDKTAPSGKQYTITIDGQSCQGIPATAAEALLRRAGLSLTAARREIALARFGAAANAQESVSH